MKKNYYLMVLALLVGAIAMPVPAHAAKQSADQSADQSTDQTQSDSTTKKKTKKKKPAAATPQPATLHSHYLTRTHLPLSILTRTRARLSKPLWSPALTLNTPFAPGASLMFSSASRKAARNAFVPG